MEKLTFAPLVDFPLVGITLAAFIWHFNRWAFKHDIDTSIDVVSRLPAARLRIILLFSCTLLLCWSVNFAVWSIFALLLGIGLAVAVVAGGDIGGTALGLAATAWLIREWAFGFPQLILQPQRQDSPVSASTKEIGSLIGKTGVTTSPLRPTGYVEIDGLIYSAASADGQLLDSGTNFTVTCYRNGHPCVTPMQKPSERSRTKKDLTS